MRRESAQPGRLVHVLLVVICSGFLPHSATADNDGSYSMISERPRILYCPSVLTGDECSTLVALGKRHLQPSDLSTGNDAYTRASDSMWLSRRDSQLPAMRRLLALAESETKISQAYFERLQVQRYGGANGGAPGFYTPHYDATGGNARRVATWIIYLNDVPLHGGGETVFPLVPNSSSGRRGGSSLHHEAVSRVWSSTAADATRSFDKLCANDRADAPLKFRPVKGSGLLFYSLQPGGQQEPLSLHGSCPVANGCVKWVAQLWIRETVMQHDSWPALLGRWDLWGHPVSHPSTLPPPPAGEQGQEQTTSCSAFVDGGAEAPRLMGLPLRVEARSDAGHVRACTPESSPLLASIRYSGALTLAVWVRVRSCTGYASIIVDATASGVADRDGYSQSCCWLELQVQDCDLSVKGPFEQHQPNHRAKLQPGDNQVVWVVQNADAGGRFSDSWRYRSVLLVNGTLQNEPQTKLIRGTQAKLRAFDAVHLCAEQSDKGGLALALLQLFDTDLQPIDVEVLGNVGGFELAA